jgi:hypothetical protein
MQAFEQIDRCKALRAEWRLQLREENPEFPIWEATPPGEVQMASFPSLDASPKFRAFLALGDILDSYQHFV